MRRLFGGRRLFSSAQPPHPPKRPLLGRALSRTRLFLTGGRTLGRGDRLALGAGLILVGPGLLLLGDTTSAVSVCLTATGLLSLKLQDSVLSVLASYLWHSTGLLITLESLPKPQWKKGRLRFENVKILLDDDTWKALLSEQAQAQGLPIPKDTDVDVNWTYWDLKIQTLDLSLSLVRWMDGKGILKDMSLQGVRGTVRRSHITWDENWVPSRRSPSYGDFELSHLKLSDVLLTLENPRQKPYNLSVYHASLPTLRKQYLLYDFFCADSMVGVVDGCLFSVHRPQQLSTDEDNGQNSARKGWGKMVCRFPCFTEHETYALMSHRAT